MLLKIELNAKNRVEAINALVVPVVTYTFIIIKWTMQDVKDLIPRQESLSP